MDENEYEYRFPIFPFGQIFAIKGLSQSEIAKIINLKQIEYTICINAYNFLWPNVLQRIYNNDKKYEVLISEEIEGWIFVYWKNGWFEDCKLIVNHLISKTENEVYYFGIDSCIDKYNWILAKNSKIYRELDYQMSGADVNYGTPITELEKQFLENIDIELSGQKTEFIFGEFVFESILEKLGLNGLEYHKKNSTFLTGIIEL